MGDHRIFAAIYDRLLAGTEEAGLQEMREELLREAEGRTLELGAGTGLNLPHYTASVTELVLTEPDRFMVARLRRRLAAEPPAPNAVEVVEAGAERLPFEDARFDTVVSTLVFCSVDDPGEAISEVARVLCPQGRLLYLEHVRSPDSERLARWQDRLERPWGWFAGGCHPNRPTGEALRSTGLEVERQDQAQMPKAPPLARPLIRGSARPGASS
ncbi:MAG: class I SAM-dependent methyltransferase [Solirubrobacterales bacterium]